MFKLRQERHTPVCQNHSATERMTMKNLTDPRWMKFKGILFLLVGLISSALLLLDHLEIKTALLLALTIWCFCRFYYFAFYVIEHYVDSKYRFSGLFSFARYLVSEKRGSLK